MTRRRRWSLILSATIVTMISGLVFISESEALRPWRIDIGSTYLTDVVGQPVLIEGDVDLDLFPRLSLETRGVRLPSETVPGTDLLTLENARLFLAPWEGADGWTQIPAMKAQGLLLTLHQLEDGRKTWTNRNARQPDSHAPRDTGFRFDAALLQFLRRRDVEFSDMRVSAENHGTGFVFEFELNSFHVDQTPTGTARRTTLDFDGTMNGQRVTVDGVFPQRSEFQLSSRVGVLDLNITGRHDPELGPLGFDSQVALEASDLGAVLRALALKGDIEGEGRLSARLLARDGYYDFEELNVILEQENGKTLEVEGRFSDMRRGHNFEVDVAIDLVGDSARPAPAITLRDIRAEAVALRLRGADSLVTIEDFAVATNAFQRDLQDIGPFHVGDVQRTPDGRLALRDISIAVGPLDQPFLQADAHVDDLLAFRGYSLEGSLDLPATQVLRTLRPERISAFGRLRGQLHLSDEDERIVLHEFEITAEDSDLWDGYFRATSNNLRTLHNTEAHINVSAPDGAALLEAMQLDPVQIGQAEFAFDLARDVSDVTAQGHVRVGDTRIDLETDLKFTAGAPVIRGALFSDVVRLRDVQNVIRAAGEIAREPGIYLEMRALQLEERIDPAEENELFGFQPLVLPEEPSPAEPEETSGFQPLVLQEASPPEEDLSDFQPLVLSEEGGAGDIRLGALRDPAQLMRVLDAEITIEVARISGQAGVSRIDSSLTVKNGQARFGPLRLEYGGGYASLFAGIDAVNRPEYVRITGETGGWDVGQLSQGWGGKVHAQGILTGLFDLSARYAGRSAFANSLIGTAQFNMGPGRISTTLIDLAGLGLLPWLFSADRRSGYSAITCVRAPLRFDAGTISIDNAVLETAQVQLVTKGEIDYLRDSISLRAEPRPVGKPLARSAWPFEITGALSEPKVKIGKRMRRRATQPLALPDRRVPCVADVLQIRADPNSGPR